MRKSAFLVCIRASCDILPGGAVHSPYPYYGESKPYALDKEGVVSLFLFMPIKQLKQLNNLNLRAISSQYKKTNENIKFFEGVGGIVRHSGF